MAEEIQKRNVTDVGKESYSDGVVLGVQGGKAVTYDAKEFLNKDITFGKVEQGDDNVVSGGDVFNSQKDINKIVFRKNFFNKDAIIKGELVNSNQGVTTIVKNANFNRTDFIRLERGKYIISGIEINKNAMFAALFKNNTTEASNTGVRVPNLFEVTDAYSYLAFSVKSATFTADLNIIQVESGSIATSYSPYNDIFVKSDMVREYPPKHIPTSEITVKESEIYIRSSYSVDKDLIVCYQYNTTTTNGCFSPLKTYLCAKSELTESVVLKTANHVTNDSISALGQDSLWFILGQHGYLIPRIQLPSNPFNLSSNLVDDKGNEYTVISISGNFIYLNPKITNTNGIIYRGWKRGDKLLHIKNSDGSNQTSVTDTLDFQWRPMLKKILQKIILDGKEIGLGKHIGSELKLQDYYNCIDPVGATFVDNMDGNTLIGVSQDYFIKGCSSYFTNNLFFENDLSIDKYHGIQPIGLRAFDSNEVFIMYPKVKPKSLAGKTDVDWNYPINMTDESVSKYAQYSYKLDSNDLVSVDNPSERTIQFHKSGNDFGIGFAAGFELENNLASSLERKKYTSEAFALSPNNGNKTYFRVLNKGKLENGIVRKGSVYQFKSYYSYFEPKEDMQSYVVNKENEQLIYIHTQIKGNFKFKVDYDNCRIIESLGINLKNFSAIDGHIYVESINNNANYIVISVS